MLPVFSSWAFIGSSLRMVIGWISTHCCFGQFSIIESSGEDNSASLCTWVLYFLCCIFFCSVILKVFNSLIQLLLISVYRVFYQTLKNKAFLWVGQLGLINYLVIFLCLFQKYLSVSKYNGLLLSLLVLLII